MTTIVLSNFYLKANEVMKQTYNVEQVKANKDALMQDDLGNEVMQYLYELIPNDKVSIAVLQNIDYDSLIYNYIMQEKLGVSSYNFIINTLCRDIVDVTSIQSKLNRKGAVNSIIYLALSV